MERRTFLGMAVAASGAAVGFAVGGEGKALGKTWLRPPGAVPEDEFTARCVRCFKCGNVCPTKTIQFHDFEAGAEQAYTPFVVPRQAGCVACMKCTQVCPSGALTPIGDQPDEVIDKVQMGIARLNRDMCYSWEEPARTCGVCYRSCPFPGRAMRIDVFERPIVDLDQCIGCGLCEQACVHLPQAIRVIPIKRKHVEPNRTEVSGPLFRMRTE